MEKQTGGNDRGSGIIKKIRNKPKVSKIFYIILVVLYLSTNLVVSRVAASQGVFHFLAYDIPVSAFTGVLSSIGNICIIFMVIFFGKIGFVTSIVFLLFQFPVLLLSIIKGHNMNSLPGIFTNIFTILAVCLIHKRNRQLDQYSMNEIAGLQEQKRLSKRLFEQTVTALVNAIDAKDPYSHGHSLRVAEYSRMIAEKMEKSEEEIDQIYYAGLVHDVGKIGIPVGIIQKKGKLTEEEYEAIKSHPEKGYKILESIAEHPYLCVGAHYHHERYDGKGYPDGLKGEDIPEIARIVAVADSYDAMTSKRSYRDAIPQQLVREEIVKGMGTQFDPKIASIMLDLIDNDTEYLLKERITINNLFDRPCLECGEFKDFVSDGILITPYRTTLRFTFEQGKQAEHKGPYLVLYDSLDGIYHADKKAQENLVFYEYCLLGFDGTLVNSGVRKICSDLAGEAQSGYRVNGKKEYEVELLRIKDHLLIRMKDGEKICETTVALPDSTRYVYVGLTGEDCRIGDARVRTEDKVSPDDTIPRIAEEISYIDKNEGDVPNVQIDGFRTAATEGIPVRDGLTISFHSKSLPTARLVWHCAFLDLFSAGDRRIGGKDYHEYALIRLDGEVWNPEGKKYALSSLQVEHSKDFEGWDAWKTSNKEGMDWKIRFVRKDNCIDVITENKGIALKCTTLTKDGKDDIYVALTGDQCVLSDIRIQKTDTAM